MEEVVMYIKVIGKDIGEFYGKDIILFGCGSCGLRALEEFEKVGAHIIGFCDNNPSLQGTKINDYEVISPEQIIKYKDAAVVISSTYEEEIEAQLKNLEIRQYYRIKLGVLKETLPKEQFQNKLLSDEETNQFLYEGLTGDKPFFAGRLGSVELECLTHYLYFLDRFNQKDNRYPDNVKMMMNINAGFFPTDDFLLDEFSQLYLSGLKKMDIIWSMWFSKFEDKLYGEYYRDKFIANYDNTVFPIHKTKPWTSALEGKKVLVIHPFETSIKQNYKSKEKLFEGCEFIPDFELKTLRSVQSIAGNKTEFPTWFEALKDMEQRMEQIDFDIALIGAGAYGLPLGAYAKEIGKKAIHIGGILQLFFGIKGKAWNKLHLYNEYWTSPLEEEKPQGFRKVEAGRYW
jgi:hypothetical protein